MDVSPPSSPDTLSSRRARTVSPDISPVDTLQEAPPLDLNEPRHTTRYVSSHIPRPTATPAQYMQAQRIPSYQSTLPRPPQAAAVPAPQANISVTRRDKRGGGSTAANILHKATSRDRLRPLISAPIPQQTPPRWDSYTGDAAVSWQAKMAKSEDHPSSGFAQGLIRKIRQGGGGGTKSKTLPIDARPEWKGGSGRARIVDPLRDQPNSNSNSSGGSAGPPPLLIPKTTNGEGMRMPSAGGHASATRFMPPFAPFAAPYSPSSPAETQSATAAPQYGRSFGSPLERDGGAASGLPLAAPALPAQPQRSSTAPAMTAHPYYYPTPPKSTSPRINPPAPGAGLSSHPWGTTTPPPQQPKTTIRRKLPPSSFQPQTSSQPFQPPPRQQAPLPQPPIPTSTAEFDDDDEGNDTFDAYATIGTIETIDASISPLSTEFPDLDESLPRHTRKPSYSSSVHSAYPEPRRRDTFPPEIPPTANVDPISPNLTIGPEDQWQHHTIDTVSTTAAVPGSRSSSPIFDGYVPIPKAPPQIETPILDRKRPRIVREEDLPRNPPSEPIVISMHTSWRPTAEERAAGTPSPAANDSSDELDNAALEHVDAATAAAAAAAAALGGADKALPLDPVELLSGGNRVAQLNARLRALANRRINVTKSIHQMTELMPSDSLTASSEVMRKREAEKKKIEVLREELAEIQREEYELGLRLHRAYKRMDRESEYEPTGLWVRRATAA